MPQLIKSLVCNITRHFLTNHCYIDADEEFVKKGVNFFHNWGEPFPVEEYRLIANEFLLQCRHDQAAAEAKKGVQFPIIDCRTDEDLNAYVLEWRGRVPEMVARLAELEAYASKLQEFPDQIDLRERIVAFGNTIKPLMGRRVPGGLFSTKRTVGILSIWIDHTIMLGVWDGKSENNNATRHWTRLEQCLDFVKNGIPPSGTA